MSKENKEKHGTVHSYVGGDIEMDGLLKFEGTLHLDCNYNGEIQSHGFLVVGKHGNVNADIQITDLENNGKISGNITSTSRIHFKNASQVKGDITTRRLQIDDGAEFLGNCSMTFSDRTQEPEIESKHPQPQMPPMPLSIHGKSEAKGSKKTVIGVVAAIAILGLSFFGYQNGYLDFSSSSFDGYMSKAEEAFLAGQYDQAKKLFKNALDKDPENVKVYEWLADVSLKEKNKGEAESYLLKAAEVDPKNTGLLDRILLLREEAGNKEGIIDIYKRKLNIAEDDTATRQKFANYLEELKDTEAAIEQYKEIVKHSPNDIEALKKVADYYKGNKKYNRVIETYRKIVQLEPNRIDNFLTLGKYLLIMGLEQEANDAYTKVEMLDPDNIEVKNNEGYRLYQEGKYAQSKSVFLFVVDSDPNNIRGLLGLATNYSKTGSPNTAVQTSLQAIKLEPENACVLNRLAWSLAVSNQNLANALEYSKKSLDVNPNVPEHIDTISEIYFRMNDYEKAIANIKKAIELAPQSNYYKTQLAKFEAAAVAKKGQQPL